MTYEEWCAALREIAVCAKTDVREAEIGRKARKRLLRRRVYYYAVRTGWFCSPELISQALTYSDRYAVDDDLVRRFIRARCANAPGEWNRALLAACIYHHVRHSLT